MDNIHLYVLALPPFRTTQKITNTNKVVEFLDKHIEALIFCSASPLKVVEIQQCIEELFDAKIPTEDIEQAIAKIIARYQSEDFCYGNCKSCRWLSVYD